MSSAPKKAGPVKLSKLEQDIIFHSNWILALFVVLTLISTLYTGQNSLPDFSDLHRMVGLQSMNAAGFAGVFALFLASRPTRDETGFVMLLALVFEILYLQNLPAEMSWSARLLVSGGGLFVASMMGLAYRSFAAAYQQDRWRARAMIRLALVIVFYPRFASLIFYGLNLLTPLAYDSHGLLVEGSLGFVPSLEMATWLAVRTGAEDFANGVYSRLPLFMGIAFYLSLRYQRCSYANIYFGFLVAGLLGYVFYPMLPMVGIDDFLGIPPWPYGPVPSDFAIKPVAAPTNLPRTCYPSLHGGWILMIYFSVYRISRWVNAAFLFLVVWTLAATMAPVVGHYMIDLLPSFPFALGCMSLVTVGTPHNRNIRLRCAAFGFGSTAVMALTIRWFPVFLANHPLLFWGASGGVVVASLWAERRLGNQTIAELAELEVQGEGEATS